MTEARIRCLDSVEIDDVVRIDESISGRYEPERWERQILAYLRRDSEGVLGAEVDGKIVGFALGEVRSGEFGLEDSTGWIEVLGVDPEYRGQAVGRLLVEAMFEHFRERGALTVRTLVEEGEDGISAFFASLGFEPAPLRPLVKSLDDEA